MTARTISILQIIQNPELPYPEKTPVCEVIQYLEKDIFEAIVWAPAQASHGLMFGTFRELISSKENWVDPLSRRARVVEAAGLVISLLEGREKPIEPFESYAIPEDAVVDPHKNTWSR